MAWPLFEAALATCAGALEPELADRLAPSAGLRNVFVHGYDEVDLDLLAAGVALAVRDYPRYVVQVADYARERAAASDTGGGPPVSGSG